MAIGKRVPRVGSTAAAISALILCAYAASAAAEEFSRGQALYENHCQSCHADWAHTRSGRKVTSLDELRQRTTSWSVHTGLGWSDEEIGDVVDYLERTFYRFEADPG